MKFIDLRSDTVTEPTPEMREAMYNAVVGDDVYGDDPTMRELEEYAAAVVGKEAALFVPSGTFGNQLALFTHCRRGDEVILGDDCHIVQHEVGAPAVIAGVQLRTLQSNRGELNPAEIAAKIRTEDIHYPETGLICLENAHSNGRVIHLATMKEIHDIAAEHNLPVHLDGARLFNAATHLHVSATEITKYCESVMFCLSKGLCAPVGSMLAGTQSFIDRARKKRKLMGGGLRQAGFLAAAGLVALRTMRERLQEDHDNALSLAKQLAELPGVEVDFAKLDINMVYLRLPAANIDIARECYTRGIKVNPPEYGVMRLVTNYWVKPEDITYVVNAFKEILQPVYVDGV